MLFSHQHTVALSMPTCVVVLASCQETEVVCKIAQRSAEVATCSNHVLNYLQVAGHVEDEHMCSVLVHMCSMVWVYFRIIGFTRSEIRDITSRALSKG